ncbi:MAG: hypothetical protein U1E76_27605 [Planctomycetota bacterium]
MSRILLAFLARRSRTGTLMAVLGLLLFECALAGFYARTRPDQNLAPMLEMIPPAIRALLGSEELSLATESGFLAMGFAHPLALLLMGAIAILNASRLAGDIEARTIDLYLTQPISRSGLLATHIALGAAAATLAAAAAFAGHRLGVLVFALPEPVAARPFLLVALNLALLVLALHALALGAATATNRRGIAVGIAVGALALMLFLRLAAQLWTAFEIPAFASYLTYYVPGRIVAQQSLAPRDVLALAGYAVAGYALAWTVFVKRDLN